MSAEILYIEGVSLKWETQVKHFWQCFKYNGTSNKVYFLHTAQLSMEISSGTSQVTL